jgi:hypothetical protein
MKIVPVTPSNHTNHNTATRRDGWISIRLQERAAERGMAWVTGRMTRNEIPRDFGVRQFEKFNEGALFFACRAFESLTQVTCQQQVEFLHSPPAAPFEHSQELSCHDGNRRDFFV